MDNIACFILTLLLDGGSLIRIALKVNTADTPSYVTEYCNEPESAIYFRECLPEHLKELGKIVEVSPELFDMIDASLYKTSF